MNKTSIDWVRNDDGSAGYTWNPLTGCRSTPQQCAVHDACYARRIAKRLAGRCGYPLSPNEFEPTFHPERLEEPYKLKKSSKIFVCSMGEFFGPWIPREWQEAVIKVVRENPQHIFQFLTKFPHHISFALYPLPINIWLGVTINNNDTSRVAWLNAIKSRHVALGYDLTTFVSAEPLLGPIYMGPFHSVDWLIIGAQTNPNEQPCPEWIESLLRDADHYGFAVFMKSNLAYEPKRREFPRVRRIWRLAASPATRAKPSREFGT